MFTEKAISFDYKAYCDSSIISEYVETNCLTEQAEYLSEKRDNERLLRICLASYSVPYLSPVTIVDSVPYLDGGISDAIPIRHAIELGYGKNIVILLKEKGYREKNPLGLKALSRVLYHKYPKLIASLGSRISRYNDSLRYLETLESEGKVLILSPSKVLIGRASNNINQMFEFYR